MAIVQISQIKHRHGVRSDLPQLATAELGWAVDTQQLYIGNGTLAEGAPEVGNTEVLTIHSDLSGYVGVAHATSVANGTTATISNSFLNYEKPAAYVQYSVVRGNATRTGWIKIASNLANVGYVSYDEEYSDTSAPGTDQIGLTWGTVSVGTTGPNAYVQLTATADSSSVLAANIRYTITDFIG
jgi:hypothetical protein